MATAASQLSPELSPPVAVAVDGAEPPWARAVTSALLLGLALVFLIQGWTTITAPFGDSHDGRNGAVWAGASRSLREDGPIASRLGARTVLRDTTSTYANHPPLIIAETASTETAAGAHPWSSRAPAWIGSLALIPLAYLLVRELGLSPLASAFGVVGGLGTPMFFHYGTMLDTPVTSLPIVTSLLLVWLRTVRGDGRPSLLLLGTLSALSVLAGWQGLIVAGVLAAWATAAVVQQRRRAQTTSQWPIPLAAGFMTGLLVFTAWAWWSHGSLGYLLDQSLYRAGGDGSTAISLPESARAQWNSLRLLVPALVLIPAVVGLCLGLGQSKFRPLIAILMASTLGYSLLLRQAASMHQYWNYWAILVVAVGLCIAIDAFLLVFESGYFRLQAAVAVLVIITAISVLTAVTSAHRLGGATRAGTAAGRVARAADWPPGQDTAWFVRVGRPAAFLEYYSRRPSRPLSSAPSMVPGNHLVVTSNICNPAVEPDKVEYAAVSASRASELSCSAAPRRRR